MGRWRISRSKYGWEARWSDAREFPSYRIVTSILDDGKIKVIVGAGHADPAFLRFKQELVAAIERTCDVAVWTY